MNRNQSLGSGARHRLHPAGLRGLHLQPGAHQGHRARQPRRRGVQEQPLRLGGEGSQAGDPDRSRPTRSPTTTWGRSSRSSGSGTRRSSRSRRPSSASRTTPTTSTTSARPTSSRRRSTRPRRRCTGRDGRRSQALQGLVAARPGLQDARPSQGGRRRPPARHRGQHRASRSRTSRSGTSTSTTTSTKRRLRSSRAA